MEEFHGNCRFIFTCNFINKIIEPLHSRCTVVDFRIKPDQATGLQGQFFTRLKTILDHEQIKYEDKVLAKLIRMLLYRATKECKSTLLNLAVHKFDPQALLS